MKNYIWNWVWYLILINKINSEEQTVESEDSIDYYPNKYYSNYYSYQTNYYNQQINNDNYNNNNGTQVKLTYYWIAIESSYPIVQGKPTTFLKTCQGQTIKQVSKEYFEQVKMEGTGLLTTNEYINCGNSDCTCFEKIQGGAHGSKNNPLINYLSIAANDLKFGTKVYCQQLKGVKLPNGQIHNGCLRVDDTSWSFGNDHIDWFVWDKQLYQLLDDKLRLTMVNIIKDANCQWILYENNSTIAQVASSAKPTNGNGKMLNSIFNFDYFNDYYNHVKNYLLKSN